MTNLGDNFYKYIYKVGKGYQIKKDNVNYGYYEDITDALYDRDDLVACNWDIEEWVWIQPHYNKYKHMILPPKELKRWRQYIYWHGTGWRIQKKVNGVLRQYGTFDNLEDAIKERNRLMESEWK